MNEEMNIRIRGLFDFMNNSLKPCEGKGEV
jgi:hypothetical protein